MKLYIQIIKRSEPTIVKVVHNLTDFMFQEGWRTLAVIGWYPKIEIELEDSAEYFANLQYPEGN